MYVAKRTFKVQDADGKIRMAQPGEDVPECDTWRNVRAWISRGFIELKAGTSAPQPPPRKTKTKKKPAPKPAPAPEVAPPETETAEGDSSEGETETEAETGDGSDGETEETEGDSTEGSEETDSPVEKYTESQLLKLNKTEIQDIADTMGLNPDQNKADIVTDIMKAQAE